MPPRDTTWNDRRRRLPASCRAHVGWSGSFALTARGSYARGGRPEWVEHTRPARPAKQTAPTATKFSTGRASPSALPRSYRGISSRHSRGLGRSDMRRPGRTRGLAAQRNGRASTCLQSAPSPRKVRRMPVSDHGEPIPSLTHKRRSRPECEAIRAGQRLTRQSCPGWPRQPPPVRHRRVDEGPPFPLPEVCGFRSTTSADSLAPRIVAVSRLHPRRTSNTGPAR